MRLLIVGTLNGQLTTATKIAMEGARPSPMLGHRAGDGRAALRARRRPLDGRCRASTSATW